MKDYYWGATTIDKDNVQKVVNAISDSSYSHPVDTASKGQFTHYICTVPSILSSCRRVWDCTKKNFPGCVTMGEKVAFFFYLLQAGEPNISTPYSHSLGRFF